MRTTTLPHLALAAGLLTASGCSNSLNRFTVNSTAPVLKIGSSAIDEESDPEFAREAAPASLKTVESFLAVSPENPDLLEVLAKGYAEFTFGFVEAELEALPDSAELGQKEHMNERATDFYDRAFRYATRLLALRDERITKAIQGSASDLDALLKDRYTRPEDAAGLYWAGLAMGSGINLHKDDMDRVGDLPKVILLLERAHQLDPAYAHHGPSMALGTVYAAQGKAMGGDPDKAKKMFEETISSTGGKYLMAKVLYARYYATVVQDRALFESTLKEVLATPANVMPEQRLANELAHKRAERYLAKVDDWFLPPDSSGGDAKPEAQPTSQK